MTEEKPLTDEQLKLLLAMPLEELAMQEMGRAGGTVLGIPITRLVAEVRRLRSDEWLARAAEELDRESGEKTGGTLGVHRIIHILRMHRDGKA